MVRHNGAMRCLPILLVLIAPFAATAEPVRLGASADWAVFVDHADGPVCWAVTRAAPALPGGALGQTGADRAMMYLTVWPDPRGWVELSVETGRDDPATRAVLRWSGPDQAGTVSMLGRDGTLWLAEDRRGQGTAHLVQAWTSPRAPAHSEVLTGDGPGRSGVLRFSLDGFDRALRWAKDACAPPSS